MRKIFTDWLSNLLRKSREYHANKLDLALVDYQKTWLNREQLIDSGVPIETLQHTYEEADRTFGRIVAYHAQKAYGMSWKKELAVRIELLIDDTEEILKRPITDHQNTYLALTKFSS